MKKLIMVLVLMSAAFAWAEDASDASDVGDQHSKHLVRVVTNDEGERLLADSFSKTLYVFDLDQQKPAPVCTGDCAEVWPPYIVTDAEAATLKAPLATVARANKKLQLTYQGRPVYTYIFDRKKGDDMGDGLGGVWHYIEVKDLNLEN